MEFAQLAGESRITFPIGNKSSVRYLANVLLCSIFQNQVYNAQYILMFDCPNCGLKSSKLIGSDELKKVVCPVCHPGNLSVKNARDYELHYKDSYGITKGKAWEIMNRTISKDDGKTVINKVTGKPAQR